MNYSDQLFKILLLGDAGVGKSSIILRYTKNEFNAKMVSSIGVDFKTKDIIVNDKRVKLQIWDTAGHERFRTITTSYYRGAHGIVTVFDLTDRESFEHIEKWLDEINKYAKENVMRFLIGNKSDLVDKRQVQYEEARALSNRLNIYYVETSAKNNINVSDFFQIATKNYLNKYDFKKEKELAGVSLDSKKINNTKNKQSGCCQI
jgi:Ras-related protein Rab-1A